jgi:2-amino-4-hydroxy-6-hydroxymethyldihydropteridine diphosphokinase
MSKAHRACLILGSNMDAESNLARALTRLAAHGRIEAVSGVWESRAEGGTAANFLNAAVMLLSECPRSRFKTTVIRPIESALGRMRGPDKFAPRPMDIDLMMFDDQPLNLERWNHVYVVVPLAEIQPEALHPLRNETLRASAEHMRRATWIEPRPDVRLAVAR